MTDTVSASNAQPASAIIPFACNHIELLCRNLSVRGKLVSAFLAQEAALPPNGPSECFEAFYQEFQKTYLTGRGSRQPLRARAHVELTRPPEFGTLSYNRSTNKS